MIHCHFSDFSSFVHHARLRQTIPHHQPHHPSQTAGSDSSVASSGGERTGSGGRWGRDRRDRRPDGTLRQVAVADDGAAVALPGAQHLPHILVHLPGGQQGLLVPATSATPAHASGHLAKLKWLRRQLPAMGGHRLESSEQWNHAAIRLEGKMLT